MRRIVSPAPKAPPKPRCARISEDDQALWAQLTRQAIPLHRVPADASAKPAAPSLPSVAASPVGAPLPPAAAPVPAPAPPRPRPMLVVGERAPGLDDLGWASLTGPRALRRRRLDLHGRTVQAAYLALHDFLDRAWRDGVRHVEIITGRGSGAEGGGIRRELPHWLNAPALRAIVLGAAHPHPRNPGSVRLLLRRRARGGS